jgi:hypothetical protein
MANFIKVNWSTLKAFIDARYLSAQYVDIDGFYHIKAADGFFGVECSIAKNGSEQQNQDDFEANYKPTANKQNEPKDADGAALQRSKITKQGWTQFNCFLEIQTSFLTPKWSKTKAGSDGWSTVTCYKQGESGLVQCSDQTDATANAIRTVLDWEPNIDYEIIGGEIRCLEKPTTDLRVKVVAVPDIPQQYGGTKYMGSGVNLKFYNSREPVVADGRTVKLLTYSNVYHTNKMRFEIDHAQGNVTDILIKMEIYIA